jgi:hypothetical protein
VRAAGNGRQAKGVVKPGKAAKGVAKPKGVLTSLQDFHLVFASDLAQRAALS